MKALDVFKIFLSSVAFMFGCNCSFGQGVKSVMVKGETYTVTPSVVYRTSNVISKTNFVNKAHFTVNSKKDVSVAAKAVFSNDRIDFLHKKKDAVLINFYLDRQGNIKEVSFNVSHAPNVTLEELKSLEDYLINNYRFNIVAKDTSSTYLVGKALWFNSL